MTVYDLDKVKCRNKECDKTAKYFHFEDIHGVTYTEFGFYCEEHLPWELKGC